MWLIVSLVSNMSPVCGFGKSKNETTHDTEREREIYILKIPVKYSRCCGERDNWDAIETVKHLKTRRKMDERQIKIKMPKRLCKFFDVLFHFFKTLRTVLCIYFTF